jgi:hypothetical protein
LSFGFETLIEISRANYRTRRALRNDVTAKKTLIAAYARGSATRHRALPACHDRTAEVVDAIANTAKIAPVAS